jgi:hypothetical protein
VTIVPSTNADETLAGPASDRIFRALYRPPDGWVQVLRTTFSELVDQYLTISKVFDSPSGTVEKSES